MTHPPPVPKGPKQPPAVPQWEEGDEVEIPGQGRGRVLVPEFKPGLTKVKIDGLVPFNFPTGRLEKPGPRTRRPSSTPDKTKPRGRLFNFIENVGGSWF